MNNINNKYTRGMNINIPDEFADDFLSEYERINNNGNDPLLMYILMKNAQDNFSNGPIGSDGYFEMYDPEINDKLRPDFTNFLQEYYPDFDDRHNSLYQEMLDAYKNKYPNHTNTPDFDKLEVLPEYEKWKRLNDIYNRTNYDPQTYEVDDFLGELD